MWTRFWLQISTIWLLFCLHAGSLERAIQGFWLAFGLMGFVLWIVVRVVRYEPSMKPKSSSRGPQPLERVSGSRSRTPAARLAHAQPQLCEVETAAMPGSRRSDGGGNSTASIKPVRPRATGRSQGPRTRKKAKVG
jgi:hypothetical protein